MKKFVIVLFTVVLFSACAPQGLVVASSEFPGVETRITHKLTRVEDKQAGVVCYLWSYSNNSGQMECFSITDTNLWP